MKSSELKKQISLGEDSRRQFKANVRNAESLASEMAAFTSSEGRILGTLCSTVHRKPVEALALTDSEYLKVQKSKAGEPINAPINAPIKPGIISKGYPHA